MIIDTIVKPQGNVPSDFLVLRNKKERTIRSYYAGKTIQFFDKYRRNVEGYISKIDKDSVFIKQYDIRQAYNMWGTYSMDTVTAYVTPYHYNEIQWIQKPPSGMELIKSGKLLMIGGISYTLLNLINAANKKEPVFGKEIAIAGGVFATGWLMHKLRKQQYTIGKRYHLVYIKMK
ncbi:MAG: hypothetical protein ACO29O_00505 [Chitinophagaceae bacterium]